MKRGRGPGPLLWSCPEGGEGRGTAMDAIDVTREVRMQFG